MARLPPETFRLPVERMREGYYTDAVLQPHPRPARAEGHRPRVRMQVFQKQDAILGGIDEAIAVLKLCAGRHVATGPGTTAGTSSRSARCTRATRSSRARR